MSLGLVVLEKKLFTRTHTRMHMPMPHSDAIKIKMSMVFFDFLCAEIWCYIHGHYMCALFNLTFMSIHCHIRELCY